MDKLQTGIIRLVKSALTGEAVAIPADFDWNAALKTGKKHQILPMLCEGVANSGIDLPPETAQTTVSPRRWRRRPPSICSFRRTSFMRSMKFTKLLTKAASTICR